MKNHNEQLIVTYPRWSRILAVIGEIFMVTIVTAYLLIKIPRGLSNVQIIRILILILLIIAMVWFIVEFVFYTVTVNSNGLRSCNLLGQRKVILWQEINEIRRPRLGIPRQITYVIAKDGKSIHLVRDVTNYREVIELIKKRVSKLQKCEC